jgi:hypothetical protein
MNAQLEFHQPSPAEREKIAALIRDNQFNGYLLMGAGLAIAAIVWFVVDLQGAAKMLALLPGVAAVAGAVLVTKQRNSAYEEALRTGVTVAREAYVENRTYGENTGCRLRIAGQVFSVPHRVWRSVQAGDVVDFRGIPKAEILFELTREGRTLYRVSGKQEGSGLFGDG